AARQIVVDTPLPSVFSDGKPFNVREVPSDSPLRFDANSASMIVAPHAKSAWMTMQQTNFLTDDDGDGVVQWLWPSGLPPEVFAAVDLSTGVYAVRSTPVNAAAVSFPIDVDVKPFPPYTFGGNGLTSTS